MKLSKRLAERLAFFVDAGEASVAVIAFICTPRALLYQQSWTQITNSIIASERNWLLQTLQTFQRHQTSANPI